MGLIKAAVSAIGSGLADQWLEFLEADEMGEGTVFTGAKAVRPGKGSNTKGSADYVSNGSRIVVQKNQFMMLVDGGKIVDYTAEEGYYTVNNSSAPSLFNGQFGESLGDAFNRIKFGGVPSGKQQVFFINLQEIKGNRFGTPTPMNYFDTFYNAELFLRAHGHYSIRITNPLQFYAEVIPRDATHLQFSDVAEQYLAEFLQAFQISVNKLSAEGERISFIQSKIKDRLNAEVDAELDEKWGPRGFELVEIGVDGLSYDDQSQELINMRNQGAMLSDATIREGFVQGQIAQGIRSAGENPNGGAVGMMGVGMGMNAGMGFMGQASNT
ncbi:MAG: SPFH domain-containing protein, partial [Stomatobaculum longum]|nr:SPFH domain-containing protein [Stomatobaculum longum]